MKFKDILRSFFCGLGDYCRHYLWKQILIAGTIFLIGFILILFCRCGGEDVVEEPKPGPPIIKQEPKHDGPYCGDFVCNNDETYWDCLDCVDPFTGGPKNGYCGDGICFNESMLGCWSDCRPRPYNPNPPRSGPDPEPDPEPIPDPIPGPDPGPNGVITW